MKRWWIYLIKKSNSLENEIQSRFGLSPTPPANQNCSLQTTNKDKAPLHLLDEALRSLNIEKGSSQQDALRTINGLLAPFAKQLSLLSLSDYFSWSVQSRSMDQLIGLHCSLYHSNRSDGFGLQLGTLVQALSRLCRGVTDQKLASPLMSLFKTVVKVRDR